MMRRYFIWRWNVDPQGNGRWVTVIDRAGKRIGFTSRVMANAALRGLLVGSEWPPAHYFCVRRDQPVRGPRGT